MVLGVMRLKVMVTMWLWINMRKFSFKRPGVNGLLPLVHKTFARLLGSTKGSRALGALVVLPVSTKDGKNHEDPPPNSSSLLETRGY